MKQFEDDETMQMAQQWVDNNRELIERFAIHCKVSSGALTELLSVAEEMCKSDPTEGDDMLFTYTMAAIESISVLLAKQADIYRGVLTDGFAETMGKALEQAKTDAAFRNRTN